MPEFMTEEQVAERWHMNRESVANNRRAGKYNGLWMKQGDRSKVLYWTSRVEAFEEGHRDIESEMDVQEPRREA